jgi:hypothetical protein
MKVFISWSGELSRQVAELLGGWIEDVLQGVQAWISTDDIEKGSLWFTDISGQLSETGIGILCLTKKNVNATWILFEAGALSKGLNKNRVCPLLVNLGPTDLRPPLSLFNATLPNRDDMLKLVKTINAQSGDKGLSDERVQKAFNRWWDEFDTKFGGIVSAYKPAEAASHRTTEDMVAEILEITRSLQKSIQQGAPAPITLSAMPGIGNSAPSTALLLRYLRGDTEPSLEEQAKLVKSLQDLMQAEAYAKHAPTLKPYGPITEKQGAGKKKPKGG